MLGNRAAFFPESSATDLNLFYNPQLPMQSFFEILIAHSDLFLGIPGTCRNLF